jgi:D-lactate dehydrogenase (cytochrome)
LIEELGTGTVGLMKTIKRAIDPLGIMNPGKVGPAADPIVKAERLLKGTNF